MLAKFEKDYLPKHFYPICCVENNVTFRENGNVLLILSRFSGRYGGFVATLIQ